MNELKKLGKEELYTLLLDLSSLRKENADFIELKLQNKPEDNPQNTCIAKFLEKTQCQGGDAVMKEFQKTNCDMDWAFYMPCSKGCSDEVCIE